MKQPAISSLFVDKGLPVYKQFELKKESNLNYKELKPFYTSCDGK